MNSVLLDTCALLWLAAGDTRLSPAAHAAITEAAVAYVSVISAFEVALKCRAGKLTLPATPEEWVGTTLAHHGLTSLELTLADALRAAQLPAVHRDPCDRFIIAAALRLDLPIVTTDPRFAQYGARVIA